ncbi:hypothetical protein SELMODRAFT_135818 [Selaginella moellendorffii]|uniref:Uncharacterized protein n=2 Tax=Selaginella moellendorffii TaxID=88036 RepID=D8TAX3_SELML|nr:hypothetical protein SELMODRAFT_135818 [Selaginella moellendorffii]
MGEGEEEEEDLLLQECGGVGGVGGGKESSSGSSSSSSSSSDHILVSLGALVPDQDEAARLVAAASRYHCHALRGHTQCSNVVPQWIQAPVAVVWSVVRRFDSPQAYKCFIRGCVLREGDGVSVGSTRDVTLVSGLPASCSTERLEILDDQQHVLSFRVVGGEHRLKNYTSVTSLHATTAGGRDATIVLESYVVDVPAGNSKEETLTFTDTVVRCNLQSLAKVCEHLALQQQQQHQDR